MKDKLNFILVTVPGQSEMDYWPASRLW